jgi:hypothetical protein
MSEEKKDNVEAQERRKEGDSDRGSMVVAKCVIVATRWKSRMMEVEWHRVAASLYLRGSTIRLLQRNGESPSPRCAAIRSLREPSEIFPEELNKPESAKLPGAGIAPKRGRKGRMYRVNSVGQRKPYATPK